MRVLGPEESVPGRPCTDLERSDDDFEFMHCMVERVRQFLTRMRGFGSDWEAVPYRLNFKETGNRHHQLIVTDPRPLLRQDSFIAVGFFGQHRRDADPELAAEVRAVDEQLVEDFPRFGGLVSYNSMELGCGDWGNLAVFKDQDGLEAWHNNERHREAVKQLSARHYASCRLHITAIAGPFDARQVTFEVLRTKIYAYDEEGVWMAVREHQQARREVHDESPPYRWARPA